MEPGSEMARAGERKESEIVRDVFIFFPRSAGARGALVGVTVIRTHMHT